MDLMAALVTLFPFLIHLHSSSIFCKGTLHSSSTPLAQPTLSFQLQRLACLEGAGTADMAQSAPSSANASSSCNRRPSRAVAYLTNGKVTVTKDKAGEEDDARQEQTRC
ncbi:hypothetical protein G6O67_008210 [Ophiocordyceps sinensis]|uniref:Uncharacterized protein n=1 Tax=Ophiocordyceps sinensis TaxID=72228 RepID=A0A8H4PH29_9HYPO|nr:hypothetical protein G6O67_008210 [Ophiocordyceps sinensis]